MIAASIGPLPSHLFWRQISRPNEGFAAAVDLRSEHRFSQSPDADVEQLDITRLGDDKIRRLQVVVGQIPFMQKRQSVRRLADNSGCVAKTQGPSLIHVGLEILPFGEFRDDEITTVLIVNIE